MASVASPTVVLLELLMTESGQNIEVTFHVSVPVAITLTILNALGAVINAWWDADYQPIVSNELTIRGVQATDLSTITGPSVFVPYAGASPTGALTGAVLANNSAVVISEHTPYRGRSYRGRQYLPGFTPGQLADSVTLTNTALAVIFAAANQLFADLTAFPSTPVVLSLFNAGVARLAGVGAPITALSMDAFLDSQRRRLAGRGS